MFTETWRPSARHAWASCLGREIKAEVIKSTDKIMEVNCACARPLDLWRMGNRSHMLFAPDKIEWAQCMCPSLLMKSSSQQVGGINLFLSLQLWVKVTFVICIYVHTVLYFIINVDKFNSTCGWYPNHLFLRLELEIIKCLVSFLALKFVFHSCQHCVSLYMHMPPFDI